MPEVCVVCLRYMSQQVDLTVEALPSEEEHS